MCVDVMFTKVKWAGIVVYLAWSWSWSVVNASGHYYTAPVDSVRDTLIIAAPLLPDVQISAPQLGNRLSKATGAVNVLDAKELTLAPPNSLATLVNQMPGISFQNGAVNTQRLVVRGIGSRTPYGSNRIKAYFGPIPLSAADGTTSFEEIDASAVERIEVIKGPSSAIYGTGLGGTVVLVPAYRTQQTPTATLRSQWGDYGLYKLGGTAGVGFGPQQLAIHINHTDWSGYRDNNRLTQQNATTIWQRRSDRSSTTAIAVANQAEAQIPSSLNLAQYTQKPSQAAPNWLAVKGFEKNQSVLGGIDHLFSIRPNLKISSTLYGSFRNGYEHRPFNVLDDRSFQLGAKSRLSLVGTHRTLNLSAEHYREKYGATYFETQSTARGAKINQLSQWRYQTNLSAWTMYSPSDRLYASLGLNVNMASYRFVDEFDDAANTNGRIDYRPIVSPRAGINYQIAKRWHLYASAGQGFSHPTAEESLMADGSPNSNLSPETGWTVETGLRYAAPNQRLWMEATAYQLWLSNLLVTKRLDEDTFYGINAGKTTHFGLETSGRYILLLTNQTHKVEMSWNFWSSTNLFKQFVDNGLDYSGNHLPGIPRYTAHLGVLAALGNGWECSADFQQWGKQWFNDGNTILDNQWATVNAQITKKVDLNKIRVIAHVGIQNIFDKKYASMILVNAPSFNGSLPRYYYPAMPRYVCGGLTVSMR